MEATTIIIIGVCALGLIALLLLLHEREKLINARQRQSKEIEERKRRNSRPPGKGL